MKKVILVLALTLLLLASVSAYTEPLELGLNKISDKTPPGGQVEFDLIIQNNQVGTDILTVAIDDFSLAPFSNIIKSAEIDQPRIDISGGKSRRVNIKLNLFEDIIPSRSYSAIVKVKSLKDPEVKATEILLFRVLRPEEVIKIKEVELEDLFPGKDYDLKVNLRNILGSELNDVDIKLSSEIHNEQRTVRFLQRQNRTETFSFNLKGDIKPGKYRVDVRAFQGSDLLGSHEFMLNVLSNINIEEKINPLSGFLRTGIKIVKENTGNTVSNENFRHEINFLTGLFTSVTPDNYKDCIDQGCEVILNPGDRIEITIVTDYKWLFIIIIILILAALIVSRLMKRDIAVFKEVKHIKNGELKILLHIKNKSLKEIKNVIVYDYLPHLIKPTEHFGTLKPNKIQKGATGIRITWELPNLEAREERIISFIAHSKMEVIGSYGFPLAHVKYRSKRKTMTVSSNKFILNKE
jgi:hypothetical protein